MGYGPKKKTLYHSELVKLGTFMCEVKEGPCPSKNQGMADYFIVRVNGDERLYNVESDACSDFLAQQVGAGEIAMVAQGSRDDATIEEGNPDDVTDKPASRARGAGNRGAAGGRANKPAAAPAERRPANDRSDKYDPVKGYHEVERLAAKGLNCYKVAYRAAKAFVDWLPDGDKKLFTLQDVTTHFSITLGHNSAMVFAPVTAGDKLAAGKPAAKKAAAPREPEPQPEPERPAAPPVEDDDVPF